jgi:hypothetical protein
LRNFTPIGSEGNVTFRSRGVRALVMLQMSEMRRLFVVWKKAKRLGVKLPVTRDPAYASIDMLMRHPLRSCRGYLTWTVTALGRREPAIPDPPEPERVSAEGAAYLETLEAAWSKHASWITNRALDSRKVHKTRWGHPITIEAMFEHAVAHPMRHRFQLEELIAAKPRKTAKATRGPR